MLRWDADKLAKGYDILRSTMPFRKWALPPSSDIVFKVSRDSNLDGKFVAADRMIVISQKAHQRLESMLRTMAHEMVHLYIWRKGSKDRADHGAEFKRLAKLVCKHHGFEEATF